MRVIVPVSAIAVLAGCWSPKYHARPSAESSEPLVDVQAVKVARPPVDVASVIPDLSEEVRWPLPMAVHPALEPQFAIGEAIGIATREWPDLCTRGIENRHLPTTGGNDLVEYLHAWCSFLRRDVDGTLAHLAPLRASHVSDLATAVKRDLANLLSDRGTGITSVRWLKDNYIEDPEIFDVLAATYLEVGKTEDSVIANERAIDLDYHPIESTRCHRLVRSAVLSETTRNRVVGELAALGDPTCVALANQVRCWAHPGWSCAAYAHTTGIDAHFLSLLTAYTEWPEDAAAWSVWSRVALAATEAVPIPGADAMAVLALESALRTSRCRSFALFRIAGLATAIRLDHHAADLDQRLARLIVDGRDECRRAIAALTVTP